ncbi:MULTISPECIES: SDR family oxidoreductase [unclassified Streptomyces]|uniref:SDR family oxidoreductase n=1 Tax=unclassified Streptomyces TaxID=2593676 RepID=UPI002E1206A2|nr:SDR family oxidoreductase [Streptomyces sp. NBC_01201]
MGGGDPVGRFAGNEEIGRMAAVFFSPIASFVNGVQVVVDGGVTMSGSAGFNAAVFDAAGA